jgi:hypothetical protein
MSIYLFLISSTAMFQLCSLLNTASYKKIIMNDK